MAPDYEMEGRGKGLTRQVGDGGVEALQRGPQQLPPQVRGGRGHRHTWPTHAISAAGWPPSMTHSPDKEREGRGEGPTRQVGDGGLEALRRGPQQLLQQRRVLHDRRQNRLRN